MAMTEKSLYFLHDLLEFLRKRERKGFGVKLQICSNHAFYLCISSFTKNSFAEVPLTRWLPWVTAKHIAQSCDFLENWQHKEEWFLKYEPYVLCIFLGLDYLSIDIVKPTNTTKSYKDAKLFFH